MFYPETTSVSCRCCNHELMLIDKRPVPVQEDSRSATSRICKVYYTFLCPHCGDKSVYAQKESTVAYKYTKPNPANIWYHHVEVMKVPATYQFHLNHYPVKDVVISKFNFDGTLDTVRAVVIDGTKVSLYDPLLINDGERVDYMMLSYYYQIDKEACS